MKAVLRRDYGKKRKRKKEKKKKDFKKDTPEPLLYNKQETIIVHDPIKLNTAVTNITASL